MSKPTTYILRCGDGKYYVGSTNDLKDRLRRHQSGSGSVFTKLHKPLELVYTEEYDTYAEAFRRERQLHKWSRAKKEALISGNVELLKELSNRKQ